MLWLIAALARNPAPQARIGGVAAAAARFVAV